MEEQMKTLDSMLTMTRNLIIDSVHLDDQFFERGKNDSCDQINRVMDNLLNVESQLENLIQKQKQ